VTGWRGPWLSRSGIARSGRDSQGKGSAGMGAVISEGAAADVVVGEPLGTPGGRSPIRRDTGEDLVVGAVRAVLEETGRDGAIACGPIAYSEQRGANMLRPPIFALYGSSSNTSQNSLHTLLFVAKLSLI
jgi:hypothetical protein